MSEPHDALLLSVTKSFRRLVGEEGKKDFFGTREIKQKLFFYFFYFS